MQSRKDKEWGEKSLKNMIEIFLNPQNDTLGGEALGKAASIVSLEKSDDQSDEPSSLLTAEKLVKVMCLVCI